MGLTRQTRLPVPRALHLPSIGENVQVLRPGYIVVELHRASPGIQIGDQPLANRVEKFVRDGTTRWYSTSKVPIRDHGGEIIGLVGVRHDITDHKRHEQMKDEFIATVNHELRTPLTSISGALDLFAKVPDSGARLLEIARSNCRRLIHLVNDILDTLMNIGR